MITVLRLVRSTLSAFAALALTIGAVLALSASAAHAQPSDELAQGIGHSIGHGEAGLPEKGEEVRAMAQSDFEPKDLYWIMAANQPCWVWHYYRYTQPGATVTWSGSCVDGKASGEGRLALLFGDGRSIVYEGIMQAGRSHGYGTSTWRDGSRHEGEWRNGVLHGHGIYTRPDGSRLEGEWRDGRPLVTTP